MWMGNFEAINLFGLFIQSIFIENFIFANFLGMCTYLACSTQLKTAHGLGIAVVFVTGVSGVLNWLVRRYITAPGALTWLSFLGVDPSTISLGFLEFLLFISIIAAFTQISEIVVERVSPQLYRTLGIYLPLIAANCCVLGASLFAIAREYPFIPNLVYVFGSGMGWWLAIVLMASIREKIAISNIVPHFRGMGITFITTGFMAMAFMGFSGINLAKPKEKAAAASTEIVACSETKIPK